jgi:hypothetical protein
MKSFIPERPTIYQGRELKTNQPSLELSEPFTCQPTKKKIRWQSRQQRKKQQPSRQHQRKNLHTNKIVEINQLIEPKNLVEGNTLNPSFPEV